MVIFPLLFGYDYTKGKPYLSVGFWTHHTVDCPVTGIILAMPEMKLNFSYHRKSDSII